MWYSGWTTRLAYLLIGSLLTFLSEMVELYPTKGEAVSNQVEATQ